MKASCLSIWDRSIKDWNIGLNLKDEDWLWRRLSSQYTLTTKPDKPISITIIRGHNCYFWPTSVGILLLKSKYGVRIDSRLARITPILTSLGAHNGENCEGYTARDLPPQITNTCVWMRQNNPTNAKHVYNEFVNLLKVLMLILPSSALRISLKLKGNASRGAHISNIDNMTLRVSLN